MNLSFTIYIDKNVINFLSYTSQTDCIHNNVHITNLYIYIRYIMSLMLLVINNLNALIQTPRKSIFSYYDFYSSFLIVFFLF